MSNEVSTCANCQKYRAEIKKLRSLKKVNESFFTPPVVVKDIGEDSARIIITILRRNDDASNGEAARDKNEINEEKRPTIKYLAIFEELENKNSKTKNCFDA